MNRHRRGPISSVRESSSSDEDDAFAALSQNHKKLKLTSLTTAITSNTASTSTTTTRTSTAPITTATTTLLPKSSSANSSTTTSTLGLTSSEHFRLSNFAGTSSHLSQTASSLASSFTSKKASLTNNHAEVFESQDTGSIVVVTAGPNVSTSVVKRHHGIISDERKAKMDALLMELQQTEKPSTTLTSSSSNHLNLHSDGRYSSSAKQSRNPSHNSSGIGNSNIPMDSKKSLLNAESAWIPDKKGSFVEPGEEHVTTNIFVGNLAPSITEEEMTDLFRQFGELYSVKIMWPRTAEERIRNRHTGFVCFMNRRDAEDAMDACNEMDPFNVGRRLLLRWGKNVKKIVKRGTGALSSNTLLPIIPASLSSTSAATSSTKSVTTAPATTPETRETSGVHDSTSDMKCKESVNGNDGKQVLETESETQNYSHDISGASESVEAVSKVKVLAINATNLDVKDPTNKHRIIRVVAPADARRSNFISTVAFYVAKDGYQLERAIIQKESTKLFTLPTSSTSNDSNLSNSCSINNFNFLQHPATYLNNSEVKDLDVNDLNKNVSYASRLQEHIFYKWRVYSFCQGDGFFKWKADPFIMFHPFGCIWIPPIIVDVEAAQREEMDVRRKEEEIQRQRSQRRMQQTKRDYVTGRQLEHQLEQQQQQQHLRSTKGAGPGTGGGGVNGVDPIKANQLSKQDMKAFEKLFVQNLCASRKSICEAMAFCFEKSFASKQIAALMRDLLLVVDPDVCPIEIMIARLFLLSDILFNSQQPGVRNAFHYRDSIQKMAPEICTSLGTRYKSNLPGRMSQERLTTAFNTVLAAWTNWGVFDPIFMDELEAMYKGLEIPAANNKLKEKNTEQSIETSENYTAKDNVILQSDLDIGVSNNNTLDDEGTVIVYDKPTGVWKDVAPMEDDEGEPFENTQQQQEESQGNADDNAGYMFTRGEQQSINGHGTDFIDTDGKPIEDDQDADGEPIDYDDDPDGKPIDDELDGKPIGGDNDDVNGEPIEDVDDDLDGEPIEDDNDDLDGEPIEDDDNLDGEPIEDDDNLDGEPMDDDDNLDGEPMDEQNLDKRDELSMENEGRNNKNATTQSTKTMRDSMDNDDTNGDPMDNDN